MSRKTNRYFPGHTTEPNKPKWAAGVELTQEDQEAPLVKTPPVSTLNPQSRDFNPHDRRDAKWARALAASHTRLAVETLVELCGCSDNKVRAIAAKTLYEMAWGKPRSETSTETSTTVTHVLDPGALHQRLNAVVRETTAVDESRQLGPGTDPDPTGETE